MSDDTFMESDAVGQGVDDGLESDEQTSAAADQAGAGLDQSASDIDQTASERDQRSSDRDQAAADIDQAESDRLKGPSESWATTRRTRSQSAIDRDIATHARLESGRVRDHVAELRDRSADERDAAADKRDALAAALDAEMAALERADIGGDGSRPSPAVLRERRRAATIRERAAATRAAAARDRQAARADRRRAIVDRETVNAELALEGIDYLTGALRRRAGLAALTRELARARRAEQSLLIAFIDVDGLKEVNDEHGHAAGDAVLRGVVTSLQAILRPYDVVIRYGGDEFVCVLCDEGASKISSRFEEAVRQYAHVHHTRISVGFAEAQADESPEELVARADEAMISARQLRHGHHR